MSLTVVLRAAARKEFDEAADWYDGQQAGSGKRFTAAVGKVFQLVSDFPRIGTLVHRDIRRVVVQKYPYCVYYRERHQMIVVTSVFHTSRDPAIWKKRT